MDKILFEIKNNIAWIKLNRPEKRNAIDYEVMELFAAKLSEAKHLDTVKAVVVTGEGTEAFCSGGDLSVFHAIHTKNEAIQMLEKMAKVLHELFFFPKPTIAYLNGTAVGGGCEIATACDFRMAEKNVKLGFIQGRLGITTGWGGSTYLMEKINKVDALELLLFANTFDANKGLSCGFIQKIVTKSEFDLWLEGLTKPPIGVMKAYKERFLSKYDQEAIFQQVMAEIDRCSDLWETPEHHEAVSRFIHK